MSPLRRLALVLGALATGCGMNVAFRPAATPHPTYPPRRAEDVELLFHGTPRPYVAVGELSTGSIVIRRAHFGEVLDAVREAGARHGCEALLLDDPRDGLDATQWMLSLDDYRATCIHFRAP